MEKVTKAQVINNLKNEWPEFKKRFESLSTEQKAQYLQKQGFSSELGMISHIIAWWNDAYKNITNLKMDPGYNSPEQDVDKFNADIVKSSINKPINEVLAEFEVTRNNLIQLVGSLDESNIETNKIQKELFWDITNHYKDHKIE